jgi:hypothetical protein
MIELSYYLSVFKDPGYVSKGVDTLSENEQEQMKMETFNILGKVY